MLEKYIPNVLQFKDRLLDSTRDTLIMVLVSAVIAIILGILLGILLVVTEEGKLYENRRIHDIAGKIINIFRSIPFVILITLFLPFTRILVGTSIGVKGAIVPMVLANIPFMARQAEQALAEVDPGVIEAARAMGMSKPYIIWRVILKEGIGGIARAIVISVISLINLSAMAGTVGGGGLGDFAIRYGYGQYMADITIVTVIILLLMVSVVQGLGNLAVRRLTH